MRSLKTLMTAMMLTGALLAEGSPAFAGFKISGLVSVHKNADGSGSASGQAGSARAAADGNQEISCAFGATSIFCIAWDASNVNIGCTSTDAGVVGAVRAFGTDSAISFSVDTAGHCQSLNITNTSANLPKTP